MLTGANSATGENSNLKSGNCRLNSVTLLAKIRDWCADA